MVSWFAFLSTLHRTFHQNYDICANLDLCAEWLIPGFLWLVERVFTNLKKIHLFQAY
jgi:hypothetical protein